MGRPRAADVMLLICVVLWAFNFTVTKYVVSHDFDPIAYAALRLGAGAGLMAAFTYGRERSLKVERRHAPIVLACALCGFWIGQTAITLGIDRTTASAAALTGGTIPIMTGLIAWIARVERPTRRFFGAAALSFAGVALVATGVSGGFTGGVTGNLLVLLGAGSWALYSVGITPLVGRYSPFRISALTMLIGWIPLVAVASTKLIDQNYSFGALVWLGLAYGAAPALVLTNILWCIAVDRVGPGRATLFINLQPLLGVVIALIVLNEQITAVQIAGGVAIMAGILFAQRRSPTPELRP